MSFPTMARGYRLGRLGQHSLQPVVAVPSESAHHAGSCGCAVFPLVAVPSGIAVYIAEGTSLPPVVSNAPY